MRCLHATGLSGCLHSSMPLSIKAWILGPNEPRDHSCWTPPSRPRVNCKSTPLTTACRNLLTPRVQAASLMGNGSAPSLSKASFIQSRLRALDSLLVCLRLSEKFSRLYKRVRPSVGQSIRVELKLNKIAFGTFSHLIRNSEMSTRAGRQRHRTHLNSVRFVSFPVSPQLLSM